jgi:translation initiation factor 1A
MVRNTHGGSGHKKFARKHTNGGAKSNKLRISEDEGEIYAIVTKMLGNGMFHCFCIDGVVRLGHIRGKFTGRGKRDNMVESGKWVLIGLREWDVPSEKPSISKVKDKIQQCDLLEVYSDTDKLRLRETVLENWSILDQHDVSKEIIKELDESSEGFYFGSDRDFDRQRLIEEMNSATSRRITMNSEEKEKEYDETKYDETKDDEVNIDDI